MELNNNSQRLLRSLQLLLLLLPFDNLVLLKDIIKLLHFTAKHSDKNKMPPNNLATLFTGHLIVPRKVHQLLLMFIFSFYYSLIVNCLLVIIFETAFKMFNTYIFLLIVHIGTLS